MQTKTTGEAARRTDGHVDVIVRALTFLDLFTTIITIGKTTKSIKRIIFVLTFCFSQLYILLALFSLYFITW